MKAKKPPTVKKATLAKVLANGPPLDGGHQTDYVQEIGGRRSSAMLVLA